MNTFDQYDLNNLNALHASDERLRKFKSYIWPDANARETEAQAASAALLPECRGTDCRGCYDPDVTPENDSLAAAVFTIAPLTWGLLALFALAGWGLLWAFCAWVRGMGL